MTTTPARQKAKAEPTSSGVVIDLDAARAARQEVATKPPALRLNGQEYPLPTEVPLDVFSPIKTLNFDFALLMRQAIAAVRSNGAVDEQRAATDLVIDLLAANPNLPKDVIDAIEEMGKRFLGDDAYAAFLSYRPSGQDCGVLVKGLMENYGLSLPEASALSESPESAGTTSKSTSLVTTTDSTSEGSGGSQASPAS